MSSSSNTPATKTMAPALHVAGKGKKVVSMKIADIIISHYVRKELDEDRVIFFAELYEAGSDVPPIKVTMDNKLEDGRHRLAALEFLERTDAVCEIVDTVSDVELIKAAYAANLGGSKPPTRQDTEHVAQMLLREGVTPAKVIDFFSQHYPKSVARTYVDQARFGITREKIRKAKEAVLSGDKTMNKAAEEFGVDIETLKAEVTGTKKKNKKNTEVREFKSVLTTLFRSSSKRWAAQLTKLRIMYENEEVTTQQVDEVLEHLDHLIKQASRSFKNHKDRIVKQAGLSG